MPVEALVQDYRPQGSIYDALIDSNQQLRPQYDFLLRAFSDLGPEEIDNRSRELSRIIQESGVTYNITDHGAHRSRPWELDLLPIVVDSREWQVLEKGLMQRAELYQAILRDLYGPRTLIHNGIIPAQLVVGDVQFLRNCNGIFEDKDRPLFFHSADVVRDARGNFVVLADRVQAPSGAGYALQNRISISRLFPSVYRESHVHRLALYFRKLRIALFEQSQRLAAEPAVVFLTAGPASETFFEQSLLASYLGYQIAQGEDLIVRSNHVYIRTVDGEERVHCLIKRIDDWFSDPLELKGDSLLGVSGLMEAYREGNVTIANPPGVGLLENPALHSYLPEICRFLFREDLRLPSVPSHWLGDAEERNRVKMDGLDSYRFLRVDREERRFVHPASIDDRERDQLMMSIENTPGAFVAQKETPVNTCPMFKSGRLEPGRFVLRTFAAAGSDDYQCMPGGLVRVAPLEGPEEIANWAGAVSKDIWVLASEPERPVTLLETGGQIQRATAQEGMLTSRTAENLFWFGRYLERASGWARVLRQFNLRLVATEELSGTESDELNGDDDGSTLVQWARVIANAAGLPPLSPQVDLKEMERLSLGLIHEAENEASLSFVINMLRDNAKNARSRLSDDVFIILNRLGQEISSRAAPELLPDQLERVIIELNALSGSLHDTQTRSTGWTLLRLGRSLERGFQVIRLFRALRLLGFRTGELAEPLIHAQDLGRTYLRRYKRTWDLGAAYRILVFQSDSPRSLFFALRLIETDISNLSFAEGSARRESLAYSALSAVKALEDRSENLEETDFFALCDGLGDLEEALHMLSEELRLGFFREFEGTMQLDMLGAHS